MTEQHDGTSPTGKPGVSATSAGLTLGELADRIGAELRGDASTIVRGCGTLESAGESDVSFLANPRYSSQLATTAAGAVVLSARDADQATCKAALLVAKDPYFAFREAVVALHGFRRAREPDVSPLAFVAADAVIGAGCTIMPFAYVASKATVGAGTVLYPHVYIGENAAVGADCQLFPSVTIYEDCTLGDRVVLHAGCVIGQDGFGYATHGGVHHKIPQIGNAVIEDDVEMGANCAVDRATLGVTKVGRGSKFSDLVTIGHGSDVGEGNLLVAQVGIAGSVKTGAYVAMGGQAGVAPHLVIGDQARVAAKAGVAADVPAGQSVGGQPAREINLAKRTILATLRLPDLLGDIKRLHRRVEALEAKLKENAGGEGDAASSE